VVRHLLYTAGLTALSDPSAARLQLDHLLSEHSAYLERSDYAKRSGLLAFIYLELSNDCLAVKDLRSAKKWADKAKSFKSYELYDVAQLKLHALSQKIQRKEEEQEDD